MPRLTPARLAAAVLLSLFAIAIYGGGPALAQERHRTLFDLLFGSRKAPEQAAPAAPAKRKPKPKPKSSSILNIDTSKPGAPVQKLDTAKHVLVIGDFMAGSVGDGLLDTFAGEPGVVIDEKTDGASGLVRNDHRDWITSLPGLLDETKAVAVVVALGSNDRQKMVVDGTREEFHTPKWTAEYERRVAELTSLATKRQVPVFWVGAPPFQSPSLTADIVTINLMLRRQVEAAGGTFIDIWEGFIDADGKFTATGSGVDGQQARLRGSDGVSLTKAGRAKAAFYVEKPLRRVLGDTAAPLPPGVANPPISDYGLPDLAMPAAPTPAAITRTEPISMTDPSLDGSNALAARIASNATGPLVAPNARDRLVLHGDTGTPPEGRVDDYKIRTK
ncbi:SGNH/GDSL hydrolase family protein [Rhizobium sp. C4]|uniref:SGNH/GDSL hydrolase family protein n=1 Tax=Rhizobium sp. C4 TaxID=1349800 RepID=UPI001E4B4A2B|nr:DUF459 domain-containing protein [Rhizobium sp. C4]MCD2174071.1 DUF459 domain-containing protein [Rhizobium sp. C4]